MKETPKDNQKIIDNYDYLGNSCSTTDCTGLIPSAPQTEAELESYESVYHFEPPKIQTKPKQTPSSPSTGASDASSPSS